MSAKILVVDDERPLAEIIKYNLEKEGFQVLTAFDGEEALRLVELENPDLVVLDIMLPKKDGFSVCREIRAKREVPIVMLTARETELDKVLGLELGADDYITKPFSARELSARIKAIMRRSRRGDAGTEPVSQKIMRGNLTVDIGEMAVSNSGRPVVLTHKEFTLLVELMRRPGHVFNRQQLLNQVWGYDYYGDERTVDVTVRRLREKIEADPAKPGYIQTKRGVGYYFTRGEPL